MEFSKVDLRDGFVQDILGEYSLQKGVPLSKVNAEVEEKLAVKMQKCLPLDGLYRDMFGNLVEPIIFNEYLLNMGGDLFDEVVFNKLKNSVVEENRKFFPLKDGYSKRVVLKTNWIIVPTSGLVRLPKKIEDCPTGMVTSRGDFVFNRFFCEKLCMYAKYKGIKAKGKKYVSNGGEIPDYYEYIEFLIVHELMHIVHGDVFYVKKFKNINQEIQNMVGDYIINYKLLKFGYNQPPIGLFSGYINYDNFSTIEGMRDFVRRELEKHPEAAKDALGGGDGDFDQHASSDFSENEEEEDSRTLDQSVDENQKQTEDRDTEDKNRSELEAGDSEKESKPLKDDTSGNQEGMFSQNDLSPKYNWSQLIKKLLPSGNYFEDISYSKISKKTITSLKQLKEIGVSSAKPGVTKVEDDKKGIFFIIDNSGSVMRELEVIKKELTELIRTKKSLLLDVYILRFDNKVELYKVDIKRNSYSRISNLSDFLSGRESVEFVSVGFDLFSEMSWGGSTIFSSSIVESALRMWRKNYNVVLFSDTDIIREKENYDNLLSLSKATSHRNNSFAIITTKNSYEEYKKLGLNKVLLSSF